jgi:hypothetical protein
VSTVRFCVSASQKRKKYKRLTSVSVNLFFVSHPFGCTGGAFGCKGLLDPHFTV